MGFASFAGRLLFASVFLFSAWRQLTEFGNEGGPYIEALRPKFDYISNHLVSFFGAEAPEINIKFVSAVAIALNGIGGILFTLGCSSGAYLLLMYLLVSTSIFCDCHKFTEGTLAFDQLTVNIAQELALVGALLFFLGMKNSFPKRQLKPKKKVPRSKTH